MNKLKPLFFALIIIGVLFKENINSIFIILAALYSLYNYKKTIKIELLNYKAAIIIFIVMLVGCFWAVSTKDALNVLERGHLFVTLPILFSLNDFSKEDIKKINLYFLYAVTIIIALHFCRTAYLIIEVGEFHFYERRTKYFFFLYTRLSPYIHPTYFTIAIAYAVFWAIHNMQFLKEKMGVTLRNTSLFLMSIFLILLLSRGAQVFFFITLLMYLIFKKGFVNKKYLLIIVTVIIALLYTFREHRLLNRYNRFLKLDEISYVEVVKKLPSFGYRLNIAEQVTNSYNNFLPIGKGTGSQLTTIQQLLNTNKEVKNTHNQWLSFYIQWGIIGILSLFYFFYSGIKLAINTQNYAIMLFLIFLSLLSLTENIVERQKGVVLLIFVYCLLVKEKQLKQTHVK